MTPMMLQYLDIKKQHPDALLFYRLGDFYEMFFEDAKTASKELELTLTGRDCGEKERAPMCGVPYHAADTYISRLIAKGYKVVICEQTESPSEAKGIVRREVVRIVTPGTVIDNSMLVDSKNNYLCTAFITDKSAAVAFADVSTGDIHATSFHGVDYINRLITECDAYSPREFICNIPLNLYKKLNSYVRDRLCAITEDNKPLLFDTDSSEEIIKRHFNKTSFQLGADKSELLNCIGALIKYISETQKTDISYIKNVNIYSDGQFLEIDPVSRRNLEICETMRQKEKKGSLLWILDNTQTAMGARLLRKWTELPLVNAYHISKRHDAVEELKDNFMLREEICDALRGVLDIERLMSKIVYATANARDLRAICNTLSAIAPVRTLISGCECDEIRQIFTNLNPLTELIELINSTISDEPPLTVREGNMIKRGADQELDRLHGILENSKNFLEELVESERQKTGVSKLKYGYNRVFGYYLEVTNSNKSELPDYYIRKQTLSNAERYITPELKQLESDILGASDKICALEYDIFTKTRNTVAEHSAEIQNNASLLALLDVYAGLAAVAAKNGYTRPEISYDDKIVISDGRHPVVEQFVRDSYFVPNDTELDISHNRLMLITGPNMAGKSTYMRQVALIAVMAQIGSFVPAKEAHIGIIDKLFTRVGASDDLASGHSTFMLEMNEVAYILKNATKRSLIIYDEIGRGTSTFDGMSIAKAVAEYTCNKIGAKTLFATHYHELTSLENELGGIINYNIAAKKKGDDIIFLRKIVKGSADDSYGIEVAKLAGVPNEVVKRAKEVLKTLENDENTPKLKKEQHSEENFNISFKELAAIQAADKLKAADINTISPIEALNLLFELKKYLE